MAHLLLDFRGDVVLVYCFTSDEKWRPEEGCFVRRNTIPRFFLCSIIMPFQRFMREESEKNLL
ncbi:MAG: hypothetical protein CVV55_06140 [Synergistetes bacterium HGW-Synergistetes-2]|nr:MAG: hypothetical protein CVV55_06140 [Synergistetes bacterium HGW-Synergistetes-2]